ncbi:outer membrane beta-barrel protein [Spirosoma sp. HMF3257]|uniref:Outer membrane protein beta-barrel domain-containing protein n=1 Tax=Spirosoma telluris TaxID=2183553 RepID=A0A327NHW0_9BACT|nr:outer membrane beta-barrel protein [Spirosoma telluris]RAI74757.1 hypothetical protein HMF3257_11740 [Spirosoma telluris]
MKNLYKPLFTALLLITGFSLSAQNSPITFGLQAGLNLSSLSFTNNNIPTNRIKPGFNIGFTTRYNFRQNLFLQSGLSFTTKGAEIKGDAPIGFAEWLVYPGREAILKSNQLYVQVPVYAGYRIDVLPGRNFYSRQDRILRMALVAKAS